MGVDGIVLVDWKQLKKLIKKPYFVLEPLFIMRRYDGIRWHNFPEDMKKGEKVIELFKPEDLKKLLVELFKKAVILEENEEGFDSVSFVLKLISNPDKEEYVEQVYDKIVELVSQKIADSLIVTDEDEFVRMVVVADDMTDVIEYYKKKGFVELSHVLDLIIPAIDKINSKKELYEKYNEILNLYYF